jgi:serine/threonine-protein kinase
MVNLAGIITTVAGTGTAGSTGNNGPATSALLFVVGGISITASGYIFSSDAGECGIRQITPVGIITRIAGTGVCAAATGDGGPATSANINQPNGIQAVVSGTSITVYFNDVLNDRIRKISPTGIINTVAGTGTAGYSGDGGQATSANVNAPRGLYVYSDGSLYIADTANNRIRKVSPTGIITTVVGTGTATFSGDGGQATSASINSPIGIYIASDTTMYVSDTSNNRIRKVLPNGIISTIAGTGTGGYNNDGISPTSAQLNAPRCVTFSLDGSIMYITDGANNRIRAIYGIVTIYPNMYVIIYYRIN